MKCPNDETELVMIERQGVEIDYCPHCRGVWLDRGELDKIIEMAMTLNASPRREEQPALGHSAPPSRDGARKRQRSWLSELFD